MEVKIVSIISSVAIINLLLTSIVCWIKAKSFRFYFWLGLLIFSSAIAMLNNLHIYSGVGHITLFNFSLLLNLSFGAYLVLFIQAHRGILPAKFEWKKVALFIPTFLYVPFLVLTIVEKDLGNLVIQSAKEGSMLSSTMVYNLMIVFYSIGANIWLLVTEFRKNNYGKDLVKQLARKEALGVMLLLQLMAFVPFIFNLKITYVIMYMPVFGQLYFIYLFIRMWKLEQNMPENDSSDILSKNLERKIDIKYASIKLSEEKICAIKSLIVDYMEKNQPYLKHEFSLTDMSKAIHVPHNIISMVLNSRLDLNFADFVNQYRVYRAKEMLLNMKHNHLTIETIAYDCGFNNRTSFYSAFKRFTNMSPKDFIKQNTLYCVVDTTE